MGYTPEQIARVCHEANRALQVIHADEAIPVSPPWDDLDEETRASGVSGVIAALGGATPEQSHENWCAFKRAAGWTPGPVKDEAAKTHPCLVPYGDLSSAMRDKDHLFTAVARTLGAVPG